MLRIENAEVVGALRKLLLTERDQPNAGVIRSDLFNHILGAERTEKEVRTGIKWTLHSEASVGLVFYFLQSH